MVVTCDIEFDNNPEATFYVGQFVSGSITLTADKEKQVQAIVLRINGCAYTSWTEDHGFTYFTRNKTTKWYTGQEDYITSVNYLQGSDDERHLMVVQPGVHTFNFAYNIPHTCPSSYEGSHGHVRYTIVVVLKRPWKFDQTYTKGFTVLNMIDLNEESQIIKEPANAVLEKTFCFWPCQSLPLRLIVSLPQSGYVPGQKIPVNVLVTNDSNCTVEEIVVELVMLVCYYSKYPKVKVHSERTVMASHKVDSVMRQSQKLLEYPMQVPATPPTCSRLCGIIQINYQLEVLAKLPFWESNQKVTIPLVIGNLPLVKGGILRRPQSHSVLDSRSVDPTNGDNASREASGVSFPWSRDSIFPQPNFEEATHVTAARNSSSSQSHEYGQIAFIPKYPVFPENDLPGDDTHMDQRN